MKSLIPLVVVSSIALSGCLSGGGYMTNRLIYGKGTVTFASYKPTFFFSEQAKKEIVDEYVGEYVVEKSWRNVVYAVHSAKIEMKDNKLSLSIYPKNWEIPSYKLEFETCYVLDAEKLKGLDEKIRTVTNVPKEVSCDGKSNGEFIHMHIAPTTAETSVTANSELFLGSLVEGLTGVPKVKVGNSSPYVMTFRIWLDSSQPVLALRKVK